MPAEDNAAPAAGAPAPSGEAPAEMRLPGAGVFGELSSAFASARAALSNFLELISFEARRAGVALMWMVASGVAAAICIVAAWLGLMAAFAMWLISLGFPAYATLVGVAVINGVAGVALIYVCIVLSRDLLFAATRRQLAGKSPVTPPAP